jgi:UDP-GlcNAc:undecaprenyl-phosphate GlcNAc-1-phosphate transferase
VPPYHVGGLGKWVGEMALATFFVALLVTLALTPVVRAAGIRLGLLKAPAERTMHTAPMPHLGGVAMAAAFVAAVVLFDGRLPHLDGYLLGAAVALGVGLVDDIRSIRPSVKLLGQVVAALVLALSGVRVAWITNPTGGPVAVGAFGIPLTVFWVVAVMNTVNLIDGLDGLAGGVTVIASLAMSAVALHQHAMAAAVAGFGLAGAALGFLRYNFYPASIFMGDTGSNFLGYTLAALAVLGTAKDATTITLAAPVLALALPIFDTGFAIFRRVRQGRPIGEPDRGHIHHRLVDLGLGHRRAVLILYLVAAVFALASVLLVDLPSRVGIVVAALAVLVVLAIAGRSGVLRLRLPKHAHAPKAKEYHQG